MTVSLSKPSDADMAAFDKWLGYFTPYFAAMNDNALKSAWWLYGRDSEESAPPRDMAAWAAVNAAMQDRGL